MKCGMCGDTGLQNNQPCPQCQPPAGGYRVELDYYKPNGTFYSHGEYLTKLLFLHDIFDEVRHLRADSNLPGIKGNDWVIHVSVPGHRHNHPTLIGLHELNWVQPEIPFPIHMITSIQPKYTTTMANHLGRLMVLYNEGYWDNEKGNWGNLLSARARYAAQEENDRTIGVMHTRIKGLQDGE